MKFLAFLLLVAVFQTTQPVPRKKVSDSGQANQPLQKIAGSNPKASSQSGTPENVAKPDVSKENGDTQKSEDKKESVDVVSVPRIDVSKDLADYTLIAANLILTLGTLIIALYSIKQANAAKRSADYAERTARLTRRADILLDAVSLNFGQSMGGQESRVILVFKNFGPTRGNEVKLVLNIVIPGVLATDSSLIPALAMGAGDTKQISSQQFADFLNDKTAQDIFTRQIPLKFEAEATYVDVFSAPHKSFYAGTYDWETQTFHIDKHEAD